MRAFADRRDAGRRLARRLDAYVGRPDVVVLALPRGGVPVAYEIAVRLGATLDVLVVRKLGVPGGPELERRERAFRGGRAPIDVAGKTTLLVDDGLATGASMAAAIEAIRAGAPARVIGAVPVAPRDVCEMLRTRADEMVCLYTPSHM